MSDWAKVEITWGNDLGAPFAWVLAITKKDGSIELIPFAHRDPDAPKPGRPHHARRQSKDHR